MMLGMNDKLFLDHTAREALQSRVPRSSECASGPGEEPFGYQHYRAAHPDNVHGAVEPSSTAPNFCRVAEDGSRMLF